MVRRIYMAAGLILGLIVGASFPAAAQSGRTFYIDYSSGSNLNPGTKAKPWKTHPYMQTGPACTGIGYAPPYTHQAGDHFIFKGGVTWPAACFGMVLTAGGTSGAQDYYGVDKNWYTGSAWTRPKFDLADAVPTGRSVVKIKANYVTIDNIEIANQGISTSFGNDAAINAYGSTCGTYSGILLQDLYIHDFVTTDHYGVNLGPNYEAGGVIGCGVTLDHSTISDAGGYAYNDSGTKVTIPIGGACVNCAVVENSTFHDTMAGCFTVPSCHDNQFYSIAQSPWDNDFTWGSSGNRPHTQVIEDDWTGDTGGETVYNNYIHDTSAGVTIYVKYNSRVYNNVLVNNSNTFILLGNPASDNSSNVGHIYNNTVQCTNGNSCVGHDLKGNGLGTIYLQNNLWITNGTPPTCFGTSACSSIGTIDQSNNYTMSTSEASTYGFTQANKYKPTSTDSNVSARGLNLTSSCGGNLAALCRDTSGAPWIGGSYIIRPAGSTAWDLGAYEFTAQLSSQPVPPSGLIANVQ